jgi:hypothetical protein
MDNIEGRIVNNIQSLLMILTSKGVKSVSLAKLVLFINREFGVQMDEANLAEILSDNGSVASLDGDTITLGKQEEASAVEDDIKANAEDQAYDNLTSEAKEFGKVAKIFEGLKVGDELSAKKILLKESDKDYFKHMGAKKADSTYIITKLCPHKTVEESYIQCKVKGEPFFVDIPAKAL